jgi:heat-inducible transcriptional repressor
MIDLTPRQVQILRAIIEEFIQTAEPVGSDRLDKKFNIGVSPATIRNEMVYLTTQGYLNKSHTSSGRVPTPLAMRLYVNELMKEKELSVADEVSAKEKIWNNRQEIDDVLRCATQVLADRSRALGLAMTMDQHLYHAGYANLLKMPEFYDINVMRHALTLIEEAGLLNEIFDAQQSEDAVHVVYGTELGNRHLQSVGLIHMKVLIGGQPCRIAVLGSTRFEYRYMIPLMRYFRGMIEEMTGETHYG